MFRRRSVFRLLLFLAILSTGLMAGGVASGLRQGGSPKEVPVVKLSTFDHAHFDANTIDCALSNDGLIVDHRVTGSSGMEWPRGTGKTVDFASGLWLAGIGHDDGMIHTACCEYSSELVPGPLGGDPEDEAYRIYKINSDGTGDWNVWPVAQGAPVDENGDPAIIGDQTLWWLSNDGEANQHDHVFGTEPMNLEIRYSVFGFDRDDAMGHAMLVRWEIINKSSRQYDSCYAALWDDPDVGDASDDLVGCDTLLNLGYGYNDGPVDAIYGFSPPALGFIFLQGPEEPRGSGHYLPITSFIYYWGAAPDPYGDPDSATQAYWFMKGFAADGSPYLDHQGHETRFVFAGDPVAGTGHLDGVEIASGDRRFLMGSGPFTLAPGDTQVVAGAKIVGSGYNHLQAVSTLRSFARFLRSAYANDFTDMPTNLDVRVTYPDVSRAALDIQVGFEEAELVVASLFDGQGALVASETLFDDGQHQDGDPGDGLWGGSLLLDRCRGPLSMSLEAVYPQQGSLEWPGIRTNISTAGPLTVDSFSIGADHINDDGLANPGEIIRLTTDVRNRTAFDLYNVTLEPVGAVETDLIQELHAPNGRKVFSEISAGETAVWDYDPDSAYVQFALSPDAPGDEPVHMIFQLNDDQANCWLDTLAVPVSPYPYSPQYGVMDLMEGMTEGRFGYMIVDPRDLTGHVYQLRLAEQSDELVYHLEDQTISAVLLSGQNFPDSIGFFSPTVDGFKITAGNATDSARADIWQWDSMDFQGRWLTGYDWGGDLFWGGIGLGRDFFGSTLHNWDHRCVRLTFDSSGELITRCKVYRRDAGYNVQPGLGVFPGAAYDVADTTAPRRLNIVLAEDDTPEKPADMTWDPDTSSTGGRELLFVMNSDYDSLDGGGYDDADLWGPSADVLFSAWLHVREGHELMENSADLILRVNGNLVRPGDVFTFTPIWSEDRMPQAYALSQNYPNPFNSFTAIEYAVHRDGRVELAVYNILGQEVTRLVDRWRTPGIYRVDWNADRYGSGIYFCRLKAGDEHHTIKMVLLK